MQTKRNPPCKHHLLVKGLPWCGYTANVAGMETARETGVIQCSYLTMTEAYVAAKTLHCYGIEGVAIGMGGCPTMMAEEEAMREQFYDTK